MKTPISVVYETRSTGNFTTFTDKKGTIYEPEDVCDAINNAAAEIERLKARIEKQDEVLDIKRDHICELEDQLQNSEQY